MHVTIIFYREEILHLWQNIINVHFMAEMCDVIRLGKQHNQKAHEVRFGTQSLLVVTDRVKAL